MSKVKRDWIIAVLFVALVSITATALVIVAKVDSAQEWIAYALLTLRG